MSEWLPLLNNISSGAVILACWWLSHQYASMRTRYRRAMAVVYALLGMMVLLSMMLRLSGLDPLLGGAIIKGLIATILIYVVLFIRRNYDIG